MMQRSAKVSAWIGSMAMVALLGGVTARAAGPAPAGKATVTVKVVDADGKPASGAKVTLRVPVKRARKSADATTRPAAERPVPITATTDADGSATLKDVADGSYNVAAATKGFRAHAKVTVADGKADPVSLTLAAVQAK